MIIITDSAYLKIAAVRCNKFLLVFLSLFCIEHHPPQTLIEVSVVEGKIMPGKLSIGYTPKQKTKNY
jgi:hypothetical protein